MHTILEKKINMNEIKKAFELYQSKFPNTGDYICLCEVINKRGYSDAIIKKAFKKFVLDTPSLTKKEIREYIDYLTVITHNVK